MGDFALGSKSGRDGDFALRGNLGEMGDFATESKNWKVRKEVGVV